MTHGWQRVVLPRSGARSCRRREPADTTGDPMGASRRLTVEHSAHLTFFEVPNRYSEVLTSFLERVEEDQWANSSPA